MGLNLIGSCDSWTPWAQGRCRPLQVFMTTHSPVALRELSGSQLFVVRSGPQRHSVMAAGEANEVQSTLRKDPEAFLAKSIIVCEGASEVGFARGLDQWWGSLGATSFLAHGGAYVDAGGEVPITVLSAERHFRT